MENFQPWGEQRNTKSYLCKIFDVYCHKTHKRSQNRQTATCEGLVKVDIVSFSSVRVTKIAGSMRRVSCCRCIFLAWCFKGCSSPDWVWLVSLFVLAIRLALYFHCHTHTCMKCAWNSSCHCKWQSQLELLCSVLVNFNVLPQVFCIWEGRPWPSFLVGQWLGERVLFTYTHACTHTHTHTHAHTHTWMHARTTTQNLSNSHRKKARMPFWHTGSKRYLVIDIEPFPEQSQSVNWALIILTWPCLS